MFSESGSPTSDYFCPFAKTPNRRSGETSFLLLPAPGPAEPRPSSKLPPAWVGPAGEGWPGVPAWPLPAKESKCGRFLGFGLVYPPDLGPPPSPPPPRHVCPEHHYPSPRSPSGSSTVRARRSERVRRLSCSIALSILGAPSAPTPPPRRPPRPAPYIPPPARSEGAGTDSPQLTSGGARAAGDRVLGLGAGDSRTDH